MSCKTQLCSGGSTILGYKQRIPGQRFKRQNNKSLLRIYDRSGGTTRCRPGSSQTRTERSFGIRNSNCKCE